VSITTIVSFLNMVNVLNQGAVGNGKTDDTVKIQNAIDTATAEGKTVYFPAKTYLVSPKKARESSSSDWWCLRIPSNAKLYFQPGAVLRLMNNAPEWTRVLVLNNVSDVQIQGLVEIDGRCSTVKAGNEHMAGIFLYSANNVSIEAAYSHDAYGDNIFVGGTEAAPSTNIDIGTFRGVTAGRKNFVIHYVDKLHVQTAILDNSRGGAPNFKGANSLDLEPDNYTGRNTFSQRFDYLSTYGTGNDFTVGMTRDFAEKWVLDVGTFDVKTIGASSTVDGNSPAMQMYAVTLRVSELTIRTLDNLSNIGVQMLYGGVLEASTAFIEGGIGMALDLRASAGEKPSVSIKSLTVSRPLGGGITAWGADVHIGRYETQQLKDQAINIYATAPHIVKINEMQCVDSSSNQVILVSTYNTNKSVLDIDTITVTDNRSSKAKRIFEFTTETAMDGTRVGSINNPQNIAEWGTTSGNFKERLRLGGGTNLAAVYLCKDTPEGNVTAPVGSLALRTDGSSGALYVKETGTGKTGWSALAKPKAMVSFYLDNVPRASTLSLDMKRNAGAVAEYIMPKAGKITSYGAYTNAPANGGSYKYKALINGSDRGTFVGGESTAKAYDLTTPLAFNAGDRLLLRVSSSSTVQNVSIDLLIQFD